MSYVQVPGENDLDSTSTACVEFRTAAVAVVTCACVAGGAGLFGELGSPCPAYGKDFQQRFLGGAGEDNMREALGQMGMVFFFVVSSAHYLTSGKAFCSLLLVFSCSLVVIGELTAYKLVSVLGTCALLASLSCSIYAYSFRFRTSSVSGGLESDPQLVLIVKHVAIAGALIVLLAVRIPATAHMKFWIAMYGRLAMMVPFWEAAACLGIDGLRVAATTLGFPAASHLGKPALTIILLGSAMNIGGALINSFFCDVTWLMSIRIGQWIAVPGAELLLLSLCFITLMGPLRDFLLNKFGQRWVHLELMSQNIAIIGGLVNMTGFDAWTL